MAKKAWFETWFDSIWYHLLYQDRDTSSAEREIDAMLSVLKLPQAARVLDLACGKGRHAVHLAKHGLDVTGLDISDESIEYARTLEHEHLAFFQHDMRKPYRSNYFDAVLNMFTSFGYFERMEENQAAMHHMATNLKPGGTLLLDFMSSAWVMATLVPHETKNVGDITFHISREIVAGHVIKTIKFEAEGSKHKHQEKVQLLTPAHFEALCTQAGLTIEHTFGNYDLTPYQNEQSRRFIFIARKQA